MTLKEEPMKSLTSRAMVSLFLLFLCVVFPVVGLPRASTLPPPTAAAEPAGTTFNRLPLRFELNAGQTDSEVLFTARGRDGTVFLTQGEAVFQWRMADGRWRDETTDLKSQISNPKLAVLRMKLVGANLSPQVEGLEELPGKTNYFLGNDPSRWRTGVPGYAKVKYEDVYSGIDLIYYGNEDGQLEYDFIVEPGADPSQIALSVEGAEGIEIDDRGDLIMHTAIGHLRQHAPRIYQEVNSSRREIAGRYKLLEPQSPIRNPQSAIRNQRVGFELAAYDPSQPLVIDPVLVYATYLGGAAGNFDAGYDIAVDAAGNAYICGVTESSDFPITSGRRPFGRTLNGSSDAFVTKLSPTGSLIYSTFFGGSGDDDGKALALDDSGAIYLAGFTNSPDLPISRGAFQRRYSGSGGDAFVTKLSADGAAIVYSTYLGGTGGTPPLTSRWTRTRLCTWSAKLMDLEPRTSRSLW
jgi:hypothetical protein